MPQSPDFQKFIEEGLSKEGMKPKHAADVAMAVHKLLYAGAMRTVADRTEAHARKMLARSGLDKKFIDSVVKKTQKKKKASRRKKQ